MQLVAKGGSIRLAPVPALGANIAAGVAAYAIERAAQPALEYLGEKLARGLYSGYEAIFGDTDGMTFDELQAHHQQIEEEYLARIQGQTNEELNPPEVSSPLNKPVLEAPPTTPKPPASQPKVATPDDFFALVTDIEIWRSAQVMVKRYGQDATLEAAQRADALLDEGDMDGHAALSISEDGTVEGEVTVPYVVLNGIVRGDVVASQRVELGPTARVIGNVYYNLIEMAIGAEINGKLVHQPEGQVPLIEARDEEAESPVQMASAN